MNPSPAFATRVVRLPEERNLNHMLDKCRLGARRDNVTVIIERTITRRDGAQRRIPILEITPSGDVREVPAPSLRTPISAFVTEADLRHRTGHMNLRESNAHARFAKLVKDSREYLAAKSEHDASRKARRRHHHDSRRNANTTAMLSERAARKNAA